MDCPRCNHPLEDGESHEDGPGGRIHMLIRCFEYVKADLDAAYKPVPADSGV